MALVRLETGPEHRRDKFNAAARNNLRLARNIADPDRANRLARSSWNGINAHGGAEDASADAGTTTE